MRKYKNCESCGRRFLAHEGGRGRPKRYCPGEKCREAADAARKRAAKPHPDKLLCPICGEQFDWPGTPRIYCTDTCSEIAFSRAKEAQKAKRQQEKTTCLPCPS